LSLDGAIPRFSRMTTRAVRFFMIKKGSSKKQQKNYKNNKRAKKLEGFMKRLKGDNNYVAPDDFEAMATNPQKNQLFRKEIGMEFVETFVRQIEHSIRIKEAFEKIEQQIKNFNGMGFFSFDLCFFLIFNYLFIYDYIFPLLINSFFLILQFFISFN